MPTPCKDQSGNFYVSVSTDSPEDTELNVYGDWIDALIVNWDPRPDLTQFVMPPAPVHFPATPTVPPSVRVKMPILCLTHREGP